MRRLITLLFAGTALAVVSALPASANHSWGNYHWARTTNSFTLKLGDNLTTAAWDGSLLTTRNDWSQSTVLDTTIVPGAFNRRCGPTTGRVEVCNSTYGRNGWLGIASIWVSSSHITQGTVKVNDTYFNSAPYSTPAWRQFVMCQEVGHTLGLGHDDENFDNPNKGTCMDYTRDPDGSATNLSNEHPNQHDYDQLESIYAHTTDSTTTVASSTPFAPGLRQGNAGGESPATWGKAVAFTSDGRGRVYVEELGSGNRVITFVNWAPR